MIMIVMIGRCFADNESDDKSDADNIFKKVVMMMMMPILRIEEAIGTVGCGDCRELSVGGGVCRLNISSEWESWLIK